MKNLISDQELKDLCYEARIQGSDRCIVSDSVTAMFDEMAERDARFRMAIRSTREVYQHPEI